MLLQEDASAEQLLDLAGRLDWLLRLHHREPALGEAERLLDLVCQHHRALVAVRQASDDVSVEEIDDLAVSLIAEVALLLGGLRHGGRWPSPGFRREAAELARAEVAGKQELRALQLPGSWKFQPAGGADGRWP